MYKFVHPSGTKGSPDSIYNSYASIDVADELWFALTGISAILKQNYLWLLQQVSCLIRKVIIASQGFLDSASSMDMQPHHHTVRHGGHLSTGCLRRCCSNQESQSEQMCCDAHASQLVGRCVGEARDSLMQIL